MRAYISVEPGLGTYQDKYLRFASAPIVTNTGFTPARNVSYQVMAAILDTLPCEDHVFETFGTKTTNDAGVAPRQSVTISAVVRERFPDSEVEPIMSGEARRLYVWGIVTYDDIFGGSWETKFCHNFVFFKHDDDVQVKSYFHNCHNSGT